ncbi:peptidase family C78-domain-containing protein [Trametes punicea]|nr:peptidase family C78-domain-containing protein [Trametes punicea]
MICQICFSDLTSFSPNERQIHYDGHLSAHTGASTSLASSGKLAGAEPGLKSPSQSLTISFSKLRFKPSSMFSGGIPVEQQNVFWHASQASEPPPNFTPGLIPVLKKALSKSHERGVTQRAWLAFELAVHIQYELWDVSWGCGYRNYLMACAALMDQRRQPMYFPLLDSPLPPGIRNLQQTLEDAWKHGYDEEGAREFRYKLVGTQRWIGTADLYVAFTYRGIPAQLVDFSDLRGGVEPLLQWIYDYFSGEDPQPKTTTVGEALRGARAVVVTDKMPIILQHQGHSRTIVGCERVKGGGINLLTFDPSRRIPPNIRQAALHYHSPDQHKAATASKVLHKMLHPVETIKSKKRKSLDPPSALTSPKRKRPRDDAVPTDGEVIVIDSDTEDDEKPSRSEAKAAHPDELNPNAVLKVFRINTKSLKKKDKYQILYFPLDDPLTDAEKRRRRVVTSEKVT